MNLYIPSYDCDAWMILDWGTAHLLHWPMLLKGLLSLTANRHPPLGEPVTLLTLLRKHHFTTSSTDLNPVLVLSIRKPSRALLVPCFLRKGASRNFQPQANTRFGRILFADNRGLTRRFRVQSCKLC